MFKYLFIFMGMSSVVAGATSISLAFNKDSEGGENSTLLEKKEEKKENPKVKAGKGKKGKGGKGGGKGSKKGRKPTSAHRENGEV